MFEVGKAELISSIAGKGLIEVLRDNPVAGEHTGARRGPGITSGKASLHDRE